MMLCTEYTYSVLYWGDTVFVFLVIHALAQAEASVHAWLVCQLSVLMKLVILFSDKPRHMCENVALDLANCMRPALHSTGAGTVPILKRTMATVLQVGDKPASGTQF